MSELDYDIDPELVDDRDVAETDIAPVELPEYDDEQFELDDEFEFTDEDEDAYGE